MPTHSAGAEPGEGVAHPGHRASLEDIPPIDKVESLLRSRANTPNPFSRQHTSLDLDDYFHGPRDILKHSKWPLFLRMHGSILPKMVVPLFVLGGWATCITCVSQFTTHSLGVSSILLTVTGFVVSLGLSFRNSSAYERYMEGRKYWAQIVLSSQNLARVIWIHGKERPDTTDKDVLAKLTAINLITAFAVAVKHKLRFEPYTNYEDISSLVGHLDTFAYHATRETPDLARHRHINPAKATGEYLGISFAASNPRKAIKKATRPLGNLPLEILSYLASYIDETVENGQLTIPMQQTLAYNNLAALNDALVGTERVLTTPLPIAYAIAISQITWVYCFLLPFQLFPNLSWVTIPATVAAGYIILGLLFIGREIENPFGEDVNDLPLENYCAQIAQEMDIITAKRKPRNVDWIETIDNKVLWPLSLNGWNVWMHRGESKLREALKAKSELGFEARQPDTLIVTSTPEKGEATSETTAV
ncbi:Bestrophin, RFP-TM, chloride channel-domain-containing protein [Coniella lustricola]|uniref:Bestrophin, RFP-TM, chloride channel-domain-containing protein n=1 Tax=Coniella lustricola TaxID=2025994 RepID=A0A2T3A2P4_9PEZI|nr:Bestrophin, RFP-TM, chloride channel-domain-containing protein [Coniella lustricola]